MVIIFCFLQTCGLVSGMFHYYWTTVTFFHLFSFFPPFFTTDHGVLCLLTDLLFDESSRWSILVRTQPLQYFHGSHLTEQMTVTLFLTASKMQGQRIYRGSARCLTSGQLQLSWIVIDNNNGNPATLSVCASCNMMRKSCTAEFEQAFQCTPEANFLGLNLAWLNLFDDFCSATIDLHNCPGLFLN